jgi:site-specific recombinase XerD
MLTLERRHTKKCNEKWAKRHHQNSKDPAKLDPKELKKCDCPIRVIGVDIRGKMHRESLDTKDLIVAGERIRKMELGEPLIVTTPQVDIAGAFDNYTGIIQSQRDVKDTSILQTYKTIKNHLVRFFGNLGITLMEPITDNHLDNLVMEWKKLGANTRHHYIQILQDFFGVAESRKWISHDPSKQLVRPKRPAGKCTLPFDLGTEDQRIIDAIPHWAGGKQRGGHSPWSQTPENASALLYVLRYTGLRISDAFTFEPRALVKRVIEGQEAYCYYLPNQQKTGEPVFIVIPPDVAEYVMNAARLTEQCAFYDPEGTDLEPKKKQIDHRHQWGTRFRQNVLRYLEIVSGVPNIHPHRFRDTFAVYLLQHDVDIRAVSRMLGHTDIATTLKYYEHWIKGDQLKAIQTMMGTWKSNAENVIRFPRKKVG